MNLLDTDTLCLLMSGHSKVSERIARADQVAISVVTRIEILQGRFASVLKAADGDQLLRANQRLLASEQYLIGVEIILINESAAEAFDRLRENRKLKKIGRGDLLIACIALANRATLVTRNLRDFQMVPGLRAENWAD